MQETRPACSRTRLVVTIAALTLAACAGSELVRDGRGLLPPPPTGELPQAGSPPAAPFEEPLGPGALARTSFETAGPLDSHIDIRDAVIAPHATARLEAVNGAVILDPHSGHGSASFGEAVVPLEPGNPLSVPSQTAMALKNDDEKTPLVVRLYIVRRP